MEIVGQLYAENGESRSFELIEPKAIFTIQKRTPSGLYRMLFAFDIVAYKNDKREPLFTQVFNADIHLKFLPQYKSFYWILPTPATAIKLSLVLTGSQAEYETVRKQVYILNYEIAHQESFDKCDDKEFYLQTQALEEDVGIRGVVQGDRVMDGRSGGYSGSSSSSGSGAVSSSSSSSSNSSSVEEEDDEFENYNDNLESLPTFKREKRVLQKNRGKVNQRFVHFDDPEPASDEEDGDEEEDEEEKRLRFSAIGRSSSSSSSSSSSLGGGGGGKKRVQQNKQLLVGRSVSRSFLVKDDGAVAIYGNDNPTEVITTLNNVQTLQGNKLVPAQTIFANSNRQLLLLDPSHRQVHKLDVERGRVVEEYNASGAPIGSIVPVTKNAGQEDQPNFVGINSNSYFVVDTRQKNTNVGHSYKTKVDFTAATTTSSGALAVGGADGDIKLYKDPSAKRAQTALPHGGAGDGILSLDVSQDGEWLVATTTTYLLLYSTVQGSAFNSDIVTVTPKKVAADGVSGFLKSFAKDSKPQPLRLELTASDAAKIGAPICFTPAKFDFDQGKKERVILTTTGPFIVSWNFAKVQRGQTTAYAIKRMGDIVVAGDVLSNVQVSSSSSSGAQSIDRVVLALKSTLAHENIISRKRGGS